MPDVVQAFYGCGYQSKGNVENVYNQVTELYSNWKLQYPTAHLQLQVNSNIVASSDPYPGVYKYLVVMYSDGTVDVAGEGYTMTFPL